MTTRARNQRGSRAADAAAADVRSLNQAEPQVTTRTVFAVLGFDGSA
jgi:hypothetical protein